MAKQVDQVYCIRDHWLDYPRKDKVKIDNLNLTDEEKQKIRNGEMVSAPDRGGSYAQYYWPIKYDDVED